MTQTIQKRKGIEIQAHFPALQDTTRASTSTEDTSVRGSKEGSRSQVYMKTKISKIHSKASIPFLGIMKTSSKISYTGCHHHDTTTRRVVNQQHFTDTAGVHCIIVELFSPRFGSFWGPKVARECKSWNIKNKVYIKGIFQRQFTLFVLNLVCAKLDGLK